ncbi:response regulator transcription factor [Bacillus kexueae]|uniref:response regulator transcription factor n=1 Tax=Aeribacillus kexueae TaxID=2078952 RepID=UPI001FAE9085|nr:response regulator transcription factor [Bacillus kexueae]
MIHILVIDDHPAVREGTRSILESEHDITVDCLEPPFTADVMNSLDYSKFDVILMDMNLGEINGIELAKTILENSVSCKILLYTGYDIGDYIEKAISIGIHGAISKTETKEKILQNIRHSLQGEIILPYDFVKKLVQQHVQHEKQMEQIPTSLTEREKKIIEEVENGLTNQEIADKLHLSKRSIEYSLTSIYTKLNVGSRTEAVLVAKAEGFID